MNVLKEIALGIVCGGAVIWLPCLIGAVCWAVRYHKRAKAEKEEIVYE